MQFNFAYAEAMYEVEALVAAQCCVTRVPVPGERPGHLCGR